LGHSSARSFILSTHEPAATLAYASFLAADYAGTTYVDDFKRAVGDTLSNSPETIVRLAGIRVPWEKRPDLHIYIAAPDFDFVDRTPIELVQRSLQYHNFSPHRPVQESGQMGKNASTARRQGLFNADMELLERCQMVVAVLPYDDPGTLIEIGLAASLGKPVLVFVPRPMPDNLMLLHVPRLVTQKLDELIDGVFRVAAELFTA
jgi:nucleoside 2-deoxyribosyltransferase